MHQNVWIDDACYMASFGAFERHMQPTFEDVSTIHARDESLRVGMDIVDIRRIAESIDMFGDRFIHRLFSEGEISYALSGDGGDDQTAERLAARFAAKEAAIKAFNLGEEGVSWRDIEVLKLADGACRLALHGKAAARAAQLGVCDIALSLSHDGGYAAAVVTALVSPAPERPHYS